MTTFTAAAPAVALPPARKAVFTPPIDTLAIGGVSIAVFLVMLLVPAATGQAFSLKRFLILEALLNWPHFTASWVLLYGSRETYERHRWAAIHVPIALVAYGIFALAMASRTRLFLDLSGLVTSCYLAVHYTGQAWGMVATSTFLAGMPVAPLERRLLRASLWIFLAWQIAWNLHFFGFFTAPSLVHLGPDKSVLLALFRFMSALTPIAIGLGVTGFALLRRRVGRALPARVYVPWLAICLWYAALGRYPNAIYWVQLSHATQYMLFPIRVETNRHRARASDPARGASARHGLALHMAFYLAAIVGSGWLIYAGVESISPHQGPLAHLPFMVSNIVNIHHYFTDVVVWKIRNPAVRRELFAHLSRA
ncbi:MAG: hypothetical protein IPK07_16385 [Deltaproteobacteria bacterium]|nr:hypothetical protein [Deltaproteobacteria bacterium]